MFIEANKLRVFNERQPAVESKFWKHNGLPVKRRPRGSFEIEYVLNRLSFQLLHLREFQS